jgi:hypothetical protein
MSQAANLSLSLIQNFVIYFFGLLSGDLFSFPRYTFEKTGLQDIHFSKPDFQISKSEFHVSGAPIFNSGVSTLKRHVLSHIAKSVYPDVEIGSGCSA